MTASLLPPYRTPWLTALEETSAARRPLDLDAVRRIWDPAACPAEDLWALAHALSVDLWNEDWPEWKKRSVIARWVELEFAKGTLAGLQDFLAVADARLAQILTPPQAVFLARDLSKAERDAWLSAMPALRITLGHRFGEWVAPSGLFLGDNAFLDEDAFAPDDGPALYGRRAVLRRGEDDIDLRLVELARAFEDRPAVRYERAILPGDAGAGLVLDDGALGATFLEGAAAEPRAYTYAVESAYVHETAEVGVTAVPPGYDPLGVRFVRESDVGEAGASFFAGEACDVGFLTPDLGGELLADVLRLHDPDVAAPLVEAASFLGHARLGMPAFHAELLVEAPHVRPAGDFALGQEFLGEGLLAPEDHRHLDRAFDAVKAARAQRDHLAVSFQITRPRTLADGLDLTTGVRLGDRLANHL